MENMKVLGKAVEEVSSEKTLETVLNDKKNWKDITEELFAVSDGLKIGELVHPEHFQLADGMSAIEIMQPKTDTGMASAQAPSAFDLLGKELNANPSDEEVVGLMDALIACEMTWMEGFPAVQTVLSCVYTHIVEEKIIAEVEHNALRLYLRSYLRGCARIYAVVQQAMVFEEEDFVLSGLQCFRKEELEKELMCELEKLEDSILASEMEENVKRALWVRLHLRRQWVALHKSLCLPQCKGLKAGVAHAKDMLSLLPELRKSEPLGKRKDAAFVVVKESLVSSCAYPRKYERTDPQKAFDALERYLHRVCLLAEIPEQVDSLESAIRFGMWFTREKGAADCIVSRSLAFSLVWQDSTLCGKLSMRDMIVHSLRRMGLPSTLDKNEHVIAFAESTGSFVLLYLRMAFHNIGRQRRKIANLFPLLGPVRMEAELADQRLGQQWREMIKGLQQMPFVMREWTHLMFVELVMEYIMTGFRLELYDVAHVPEILWYAAAVANSRTQTWRRIASQQKQMYPALLFSTKKSKKLKGHRREKLLQLLEKEGKSITFANGIRLHWSNAAGLLLVGLHYLTMALVNNKLVCVRVDQASAIAFRRRFVKVEEGPSPLVLDFAEFAKLVQGKSKEAPSSTKEWLEKAAQQMKSCKEMCKRMQQDDMQKQMDKVFQEDVRCIGKVVAGNAASIMMAQLGRLGKSMIVDVQVHPLYPVIRCSK